MSPQSVLASNSSIGKSHGSPLSSSSSSQNDSKHLTKIVLVQKSHRVGHLLCSAKCVFAYLIIWQMLLIVCNLLLIFASPFRLRANLVVIGRPFYLVYLLFCVLLIRWLFCSIKIWRCKDNLDLFTNLGFSALLFAVIDAIILCRLLVRFTLTKGFVGKFLAVRDDFRLQFSHL